MNKPHISKLEWERDIRPILAAKNVDRREREKIEGYLWASFDRDPGDDTAGITEEEINDTIKYMRKHSNEHHIADSKITILEELLKKYL